MFNVLATAQSLSALLSGQDVSRKGQVSNADSLNENRLGGGTAQSYSGSAQSAPMQETQATLSSAGQKAQATNALTQIFYGTGSRLDVYA
jgi:hypothetical protein